MSRLFVSLVCVLTITCSGIVGCASAFGVNSSSPFRRGAQKEPEVEEDEEDLDNKEASDWKKETKGMRGEGTAQPNNDSWIDKYIWSSESRDIMRSLNVNP